MQRLVVAFIVSLSPYYWLLKVATNVQLWVTETDSEFWTVQGELDDLATMVRESPEPGFAGLTVDASAKSLTVYWVQPLSNTLSYVVSLAADSGLTIRVAAASHSVDEVNAAVKLLLARYVESGDPSYLSVRPAEDSSQIEIGISSNSYGAELLQRPRLN